jgi:hypothetical protein
MERVEVVIPFDHCVLDFWVGPDITLNSVNFDKSTEGNPVPSSTLTVSVIDSPSYILFSSTLTLTFGSAAIRVAKRNNKNI